MNLELKKTNTLNVFVEKNSSRRKIFSPPSSEKNISTHLYLEKKKTLFVGDSEGSIHMWKPKYEFKSGLDRSKLTGHLGTIFKFLYLDQLKPGLLFSASADRTIKMWDIWGRDVENRLIQSLVGHGGTVLDMDYNQGIMVSCSTDRYVL